MYYKNFFNKNSFENNYNKEKSINLYILLIYLSYLLTLNKFN